MSDRRKIRWLIAHYPVHLFQRTAEAFGCELETLCPGQFEVEIHTVDSFVEQYNKLHILQARAPQLPGLEEKGGRVQQHAVKDFSKITEKWDTFFNALRDGEFEMSQTQVYTVATQLHNKDFAALDLPFLFNDHDHVSRVLDGEIGDALCERLGDIKGLAFTYSGGYRIIGSTKGLNNLSDLANTELVVANEPSAVLFKDISSTTMKRPDIDVASLADDSEKDKAVETTYLRFTGKHVLKTNHSIFMTTILTGTKFLDSLTDEQRQAFKIAAKRVAKIERQWSIEDAQRFEDEAVEKGISIVDINNEDLDQLRRKAQKSYIHLDKLGIDRKLVKTIIDQR